GRGGSGPSRGYQVERGSVGGGAQGQSTGSLRGWQDLGNVNQVVGGVWLGIKHSRSRCRYGRHLALPSAGRSSGNDLCISLPADKMGPLRWGHVASPEWWGEKRRPSLAMRGRGAIQINRSE